MAVSYTSARDARAAGECADALGVPCAARDHEPAVDLTLVLDHGVLGLRDNRQRGLKILSADFASPESASKKQPLGQAVGRRTRTVADATAGWGDDARRLWAMGYEVTLIERNPIMAALLRDAVRRASATTRPGSPPRIVERDAIDYLAGQQSEWDCVYLDPMFPPKPRSSTLARRRLRLLRELAGDDPDRERLFASAVRAAAKRVVVKRPDHVAPMFGDPAQTVAGKLVSYDVYFT